MRVEGSCCTVRSLMGADAPTLARYADNRKVWINLRDLFPHPYHLADAESFIQRVHQMDPETAFAIEAAEQAIGVIGYATGQDVERISAEIGYWIGEPFWGRGIATEALRVVTAHAMRTHRLTRLFATPFAWNRASCRVLEKTGYVLEGHLHRSALKDGKVTDQYLYAYVADERRDPLVVDGGSL